MSPRSLKPVEFAGIPHIWDLEMWEVVAETTLVYEALAVPHFTVGVVETALLHSSLYMSGSLLPRMIGETKTETVTHDVK